MRKPMYKKSLIECNEAFEAECIETKLARLLDGGEPIVGVSPPIYTIRKDGVLPEYDPRSDKWAIAQAAMAQATKKWEEQRTENYNKYNPNAERAPEENN